jgi:ADP-heptose:LPS heptosyltransferase
MPPNISAQDHHDQGVMMMQQGRTVDALFAFQHAVMKKPDFHSAWCNRAILLSQMGNTFDAVLNYNQALSHDQNPEYYHNRGVSWSDLDAFEAAERDYLKALSLNPALVNSYQMLGGLYIRLGKVEEAYDAFDKGLSFEPNHIGCQLGRAMANLSLGNLVQGFKDFESRWECGQIPKRGLRIPAWEGQDLNGKTLMIYHEQGHGDTIHFIRYAAEIKKKYPKCTIKAEVRWPLVRLISTVPGVDAVVPYGEDYGHVDYICAVISCARVMGTTIETIPGPRQYVRANQHLVEKWRADLERDTGHFHGRRLVGICWAGGQRPFQPLANAIDKRRSTELHQWAPLAEIPGVVFVAIQHEDHILQQINQQRPPKMTVVWPGQGGKSEPFEDFADTAALIENMELVISVDTAVMHVAAALGKPTWMLSRYDGCWRWHGDSPDSPWYPTLRQFRQPNPGDWGTVFKRVADELRTFVAGDVMKEAAE